MARYIITRTHCAHTVHTYVVTRYRADAAELVFWWAVYDIVRGNAGLDTKNGRRCIGKAFEADIRNIRVGDGEYCINYGNGDNVTIEKVK